MTAAEKRERFETEWLSVLQAAHNDYDSNFRGEAKLMADLLTFTDDEPAAPADWRDQAVALGTGWWEDGETVCRDMGTRGAAWQVYPGGAVWFDGVQFSKDDSGDPLARCKAIDEFLAKLGVGA